ncbi:MAG: hypothetical protein RNU03_06345 [Candidatus Sedimenticola sp. (ex Thyasira tokunagai)]
MADITSICSAHQGLNFEKTNQRRVGHVTSLKIGDKEYKKDMAVTVPSDIDGDKVKVVAVIDGIYWNGGHTDEILIHCRISTANKVSSFLLSHAELSDTRVEFAFVIYEYDPVKAKYFPFFHTNETNLNGLVSKDGGKLRLIISNDQEEDVVSPKNFRFYLGVMPSEKEQGVHVAGDDSAKLVKKWGVTVAE